MAQAATETPTTTEDVARAYFEAHERRDLDTVAGLWEPGKTARIIGVADLRAPDELRAYFQSLYDAFPDFQLRITSITAQDERAWVRWAITGTFAGPASFQGFEPTGGRLSIEGADLLEVHEGRVHSIDAYTDNMTIARQLGALPPQDSATEQRMTKALNLRTRLAGRMCEAPEQIAEGVWIVRGGLPRKAFNVYFVRDTHSDTGGDGVLMFDAGIKGMSNGLAAAGAQLGGITRIVLGHGHVDHRGAAPGLHGIPVYCHPDNVADATGDGGIHYSDLSQMSAPARWIYPALLRSWDGGPVEIAGTIEEGEDVAGFEVVLLPGHAPGQIGLWRASDRLALTTDCFYTANPERFTEGPPIVPHRAFNFDHEQAIASVRKLAALEPASAWPGHSNPLTGDVRSQLEAAADRG
jgi:glyoxylase-like metal-dependent hydrolase (beta-lactamase superfamily II)/predicted ester cyclase